MRGFLRGQHHQKTKTHCPFCHPSDTYEEEQERQCPRLWRWQAQYGSVCLKSMWSKQFTPISFPCTSPPCSILVQKPREWMPKACKLFSINSLSPILEHFSFSDLTPWWVMQVFDITDGQKFSSFQFCIIHDELDSYKPVPVYPLTPVILLVWQ